MADAVGDRVAPLVIVGGAGLAALVAMAIGAPPVVVPVIAALPLILAIGRDRAMGLVIALVVARALTDDSGNRLLSVGIAMAVTALAALVLLGTRGVAAPTTVLVALLFASAAYGAHAYGASVTIGEAFRLMSVVAVALVAAHSPGRLTLGRIAGAVQLVAIFPALVAVYQLATGTGSDIAGSIRSYGTLVHPNSAAMLFALANLVTFSRVLDRHSRRWFQLGLLALFLVAQASTGSLGGATAALAMVLVYLFARPVRQAGRIIVTAAGLAVGTVLVFTSSIGAARISEFQNPVPGKSDSFNWRLTAWSEALAAWRSHIFLGNGLGSTLAKTIVPGNIPHNEYVRLLAEVGVLGSVAVIAIDTATGAPRPTLRRRPLRSPRWPGRPSTRSPPTPCSTVRRSTY